MAVPLSAELRQETLRLHALLRAGDWDAVFALPPGDWRRWVGASMALPPPSYLRAKAALSSLMLVTLFAFSVQYSHWHPFRYWFLYLTNLTLCIQCASLSLGLYACWQQAASASPSDAPPPAFLRPLLALQAVTLPAAALVTALFWLLVYPSWPVSATFVVNYFVHGVNLAVALADTWLSCAPLPLAYAALVWPYGCAYLAFTVLYFWAGGLNEWGQPWIYIPIYWGAPDAWKGALLSAAVLTFAVPALIAATWAFGRLRDARAAAAAAARSGGEEGVELLAVEAVEAPAEEEAGGEQPPKDAD